MTAGGNSSGPRVEPGIRVLMSVDAVGGVWRYAMTLAGALSGLGVETVFVGFGPAPSPDQRTEAAAIGTLEWTDAALDWTARHESELDAIPVLLGELARRHRVDLVHLNLPSQAAGLHLDVPVLVVSHSCVVSWFRAVRGTDVPTDWRWHVTRNRTGFADADAIVAPSASHAGLLTRCYGNIGPLQVVHNAVPRGPAPAPRQPIVLAAGRWWDDGKNAALLDAAAQSVRWPVRMAGSLAGPNGETRYLEHAEWLGELPNARVRALLAEAAIFVSPSLYEPFGLSALEAAEAGAALVLADIPTYRELWEGAAIFFDPHDCGGLATVLDGLGDDPAAIASLSRRSIARASDFTVTAQAEAMSGIYRRALDATRVQRRKAG